jgi:hypothetical protein
MKEKKVSRLCAHRLVEGSIVHGGEAAEVGVAEDGLVVYCGGGTVEHFIKPPKSPNLI